MATDTLTDNELIAEFMGGKSHHLDDGFGNINHVIWFLPGNHPNPHCNAGTYKRPEDLDYHVRWDWLMPVVDKIQSIDIEPAPNYRGYRIEIVVQGYVKITGFPMPSITTNVAGEGSLITAVYNAVVEFIKFYNQQTKP